MIRAISFACPHPAFILAVGWSGWEKLIFATIRRGAKYMERATASGLAG